MKPLYLNAKEPLKVSLDGPALKINTKGSAIQRFPLCRISRVIVSGDAIWSTNALLACADEGIIITFLTQNGDTRARWIGRTTSRDGLQQLWNDFLDRPDWMTLYKQWSDSINRRAVRMCAWRMGWSPTNDSRTMVQAIIQATKMDIQESLVNKMESYLYGLAHTRITEEITKHGFRVSDIVTPYLESTFKDVVKWGLYPEFVRFISKIPKGINHDNDFKNMQLIVGFYERNSTLMEFYFRDVNFNLYRYLASFK